MERYFSVVQLHHLDFYREDQGLDIMSALPLSAGTGAFKGCSFPQVVTGALRFPFISIKTLSLLHAMLLCYAAVFV